MTCPDMVFRNSEEFVWVELLVVRQMFQGSDVMMFHVLVLVWGKEIPVEIGSFSLSRGMGVYIFVFTRLSVGLGFSI